jgi:putative transposase
VRAHIVDRPEDYAWSSYRARTGLSDCTWLDPDPCFLALASTTEQRQQRYRQFVASGIPKSQIEFLRTTVQRNQLTGSDAFILEIEQLTGARILHRPPGRPPILEETRETRKK